MVTKIKEMLRRPPENEYGLQGDRERLWKVQLIHGYYYGLTLELWFPTKERATEKFSPFTPYSPLELVRAMESERYTVTSIEKTKLVGVANAYTDQKVAKDAWRIAYDGERDTYMDQWYPNEAMTRQYSRGQAVTIEDYFRSLPVTPMDVADWLEDVFRQAKAAEEEAEAARLAREAADEETEQRRLEAEAAQGQANNAAANAAHAAAQAASAQAAALQAQWQAAAVAAEAQARAAAQAAAQEQARRANAEALAQAEINRIFPTIHRTPQLIAQIRAKYGLT